MKILKKIIVLTSFILLLTAIPMTSIFAQENSDSSTSSSESLKDIMKKADLGKVNGAINNLLNKKVAIIGEIARITDEAITITNITGTIILPIDKNSKIMKGKEEISIDKVEVENWAMVLGKMENDNFSPNFIFISSESLRPKTQEVILGTIISISSTELKIKTRSKQEEKTLKISKNTNFQDFDGEKIKASDFSKDINVLVTGFIDDAGTTVSTLRSLASLSDE